MYTLHESEAKRLELPGRICTVLVGNEKLVAEKLTFGVTEVPAMTRMNPHEHAEEEVIYVLKGFGQVKVDKSVEMIREGMVIYIPSNLKHQIENNSDETMKFVFAFSPTVKIGSYDRGKKNRENV